MGARENKLQKLQVSQNEIFGMTILPVFSKFCEIWISFLVLPWEIVFGVITHN